MVVVVDFGFPVGNFWREALRRLMRFLREAAKPVYQAKAIYQIKSKQLTK